MEDFENCLDYLDLMQDKEAGLDPTCDGIWEEACLDCPFYIENK